MHVNQQVSGNYMGVQFDGVITEMRSLTVKTDGCCEYMVKLTKPVSVFGQEREKLCVYAKFDGTPSSYTKHSDELHSIGCAECGYGKVAGCWRCGSV
jgi:hypothetical protein